MPPRPLSIPLNATTIPIIITVIGFAFGGIIKTADWVSGVNFALAKAKDDIASQGRYDDWAGSQFALIKDRIGMPVVPEEQR